MKVKVQRAQEIHNVALIKLSITDSRTICDPVPPMQCNGKDITLPMQCSCLQFLT